MTVHDAADRWLRNQPGLSEKTPDNYARELAPLLAEVGRVRAQRKAALHLRAVLRAGVHEGILQRNVAEGVRVSVSRVQSAAQAWTPNETSTFLAAPEVQANSPFPVYYCIMLALGLRWGEALGRPCDSVESGTWISSNPPGVQGGIVGRGVHRRGEDGQ